MDITIRKGVEGLNWKGMDSLFQRTPLGERPPERNTKFYAHTHLVVTAWHENRLAGSELTVYKK